VKFVIIKEGLKQIGERAFEGKRIFTMPEMKSSEIDGKFYVEGYANTKNVADSYGDIPINFNGQPVYDLSRIDPKSGNPVMLANHNNSLECVMGNWVTVVEDEIGLFVKALLVPIEECFDHRTKHAVNMFRLGFARALSIGGRWFFDDPKNPNHLTRAYIMEISGVAIPADENALISNTNRPKKFGQVSNENRRKLLERELLNASIELNLQGA
jgi:phage head maturation protease